MEPQMVSETQSRRAYPLMHQARVGRDIAKHQEYSRYVLRIDADNRVEIRNNTGISGKPVVDLLVVIGPGEYLGQEQEVVLLEIGLRRTRPYRPVQSGIFSRERKAVAVMNEAQCQAVFPHILTCLEEYLVQVRSGWQDKERRFVRYSSCHVEKGIQITLNKRDTWLYQKLLQEYVRYFEAIWMRRFAKMIRDTLKSSKYNKYRSYGPKVKQAMQWIRNSRYHGDPLLLDLLMMMSGRRLLIQSALADLYDDYEYIYACHEEVILCEQASLELPSSPRIWFYRTPDQPEAGFKRHAQGCVRFEVIPETKWISALEGRTYDYRNRRFEEGESEDDWMLDDIPFEGGTPYEGDGCPF